MQEFAELGSIVALDSPIFPIWTEAEVLGFLATFQSQLAHMQAAGDDGFPTESPGLICCKVSFLLLSCSHNSVG
jgi:hypothetical protein